MDTCHDLKSLAHVDTRFPSVGSEILMTQRHELGTEVNIRVLLHEKMQCRADVPSKHHVG